MQQLPIYIVSLKNSERRQHIGPALDALELTYEFVDGIEGAKLTEAEFAAAYDGSKARRLLGRELSRGEVGASLTHRRIYEQMVAKGIERAIVLEDDATFQPGFLEFVRSAATMPESVGVVLLYSANGTVLRRPGMKIGGVNCHRAATRLTHAVGYCITLTAARRLVALTPKIFWPPDWPADRWAIPFYVTIPFVVGHGEFASQVDATRTGSRKAQNKLRRVPKFLTLRYYDRAALGFAQTLRPQAFIDLKSIAKLGL